MDNENIPTLFQSLQKLLAREIEKSHVYLNRFSKLAHRIDSNFDPLSKGYHFNEQTIVLCFNAEIESERKYPFL